MSSNSSSGFVESLGGSFFHWMSTEVLPYVMGSVLGVCVLMGIILNIVLLVVYGKRKMYKDPTNHFIPQIAIVDLTAAFVVVIPSSVSAFMKKWPLSEQLCQIHGVAGTWFFLLSFAMVILIFIERVVKAWNPRLHDSTFNTNTFVVILCVTVWSADLQVAMLPFLGIGTLEFDEYQNACSLRWGEHTLQTHVVLGLGLYLSPFVCLVAFAMLIDKRRRNIVNEKNGDKNRLIELEEGKATGSAGQGAEGVVKNGPSNAWDKGSAADTGKANLFAKNPQGPGGAPKAGAGKAAAAGKKTKHEAFLEKYNRRMTNPVSQSVVSRMFRDSEDEKDHHQAMTALIIWAVLMICWVWYLVAAMLEVYSDDVWGGWWTLGTLLGDVSYCVKPIVYLAHNRHYRQVGKDFLPQGVKDKAENLSKRMSVAVNKLDNAMFKSPAATKATKFRAALAAMAAQRVIMKWKRKTAGGIGKFGFGKKPAAVGAAPAATAVTGAADAAASKAPGGGSDPMAGATLAAAAMAQTAKDSVPALTLPPPSPAHPTLSVPGTPGDRPVTKTGVLLSMRSGVTTPSTPGGQVPATPASSTGSSDNDMAQLLNPFSPQS